MRRLLVVSVMIVITFGVGLEESAGKLTRGDQSKLKRFLTDFLDRFAAPGKREIAEKGFTDFFADRRKAKLLKEVDELSELMAVSSKRTDQKSGVLLKLLDLGDIGISGKGAKIKALVSVPKDYNHTGQAPAWPLVLCVPDMGQTMQEHLDAYWQSEAIRSEYIIAVLGFDYQDVKVKRKKEVKDDEGNVNLQTVEEKVPFTWDLSFSNQRFWGGFVLLLQKEFKIDPNRVVLDGAGYGSTGALTFATSNTWRFAGLIVRGGESEGSTLENLRHIPVVVMPFSKPSEGAVKTVETLEKVLEGASLTIAGKDADSGIVAVDWDGGRKDQGAKLKGWLDACKRMRYPLPSKWVYSEPVDQFGYWFSINERFNGEEPAEMSIAVERGRVLLTAKNVEQFTLFLNDRLVNLEKPFEIVVNGEKVWEGEKVRSAEVLLDCAMEIPADQGAVFTAKISQIRLSAPPADPKEKEGEEPGEGEGDKPKDDGDKPKDDEKDPGK